ncbi:EscU/YscU/HrcU family type III secretion system export apparatus switch protein [Comamonas sp. JC664]|uniref:EscU/YscU/HrcU family type III secretion system export apparatus switch protein n=1 Tax=Comamonas sp. JC664 TaxID=2801917 RepID=UPI0017490C77|nr:EscU/YscU/HrcU family type III secretion system export apparatus switch protein [Comamonas sp. JC664]MBL0695828.1 EscU/YscU/HrcU family type III secretion system export apparatus switch protein [Comamonas sp. JC664]GHG63714.1 EscU/YscU/HrcU family type III secretion system export apparatus switch protein [Comamonas sp. KCTC 72670]
MSGEKTEKPSAKRLREARRKGQIPRSRMLTSSAVTAGGLLGLSMTAPEGFEQLKSWTERLFLHPQDMSTWHEGLWVGAYLCVPVLGCALIAALMVSVATVGFDANLEHVKPKLERISIAAGATRLFSWRPWLDMGKALLVLVLVGLFVWSEVEESGPDAMEAAWHGGAQSLSGILTHLAGLLSRLTWLMVVLGIGDYMLARRRHLKDLMMSREELKREYKESEGDPRHKGQRKALHRQLAQGGSARGVQKATAVVVNPTHIAVALRYDAEECEAPYLVAKAQEGDALALREQARRLGIPVVRDIPLARSLIHYDVGEPIPEELYQAAAAVLRTAMEERELDGHPRRQTS